MGDHIAGIDQPEFGPPGNPASAVRPDLHRHVEIDRREIEAVLHGFRERRAAVIADEQVVVVARQDHVGA